MAAPLLPSLFPRPPLPPHQQLCPHPSASMAPWDLPPPPVQFFPVPGNNFLQPPIVGAFNFFPGPQHGFRGRGCNFRGRGRGGGNRNWRSSGARGGRGQGEPSGQLEKKCQKPAEFSCKVCNKEYRSEESYQIHLQSHQKVNLGSSNTLNDSCDCLKRVPSLIDVCDTYCLTSASCRSHTDCCCPTFTLHYPWHRLYCTICHRLK